MMMRLGDAVVSVIPVAKGGKTKYKNVSTGDVYEWDELRPLPHSTKVSALTESTAAMAIGVRIGVTATHVTKGGTDE